MITPLLLVRGASGVGKREIVDRLRPHMSDGAVLDVEIFRSMFARYAATDRQQHLIAMRIAREAALGFVQSRVVPVVLIDTFTSGKLASFVADLTLPYLVVSIFLDSGALRERLLRRGASVREVESASMINAEIALRRHEHEKVIDATALEAEAIALSLRRWLRRA